MDWIKITTLEAMPKESCDCWVFWDVPMHLVWNPDHECWDDGSGDDYFAGWNQPTHYIVLPWKRPMTQEEEFQEAVILKVAAELAQPFKLAPPTTEKE